MAVGIWLVEAVGRDVTGFAFVPGWVASFDPDAFDGLGDVTVTQDAALALAFDDTDAALAFLQSNRPLTAFTAICVGF